MNAFAQEFAQIPTALAANAVIRDRMLVLIGSEPIAGKVTEGGDRTERLRTILRDLAMGLLDLNGAFARAEADLPRSASAHGGNNRVFASGWAERLVRTQFSRFYNQAVMEFLLAIGETECFVPHSTSEKADSPCSCVLAGRNHAIGSLHSLLVASYAHGQFTKQPKIPDHPHCTHVVTPKGSAGEIPDPAG